MIPAHFCPADLQVEMHYTVGRKFDSLTNDIAEALFAQFGLRTAADTERSHILGPVL